MEAEITKPIYDIGNSVVIVHFFYSAEKPQYRIAEIRAGYWTGKQWEYEMYGVKNMIPEKEIISNFLK